VRTGQLILSLFFHFILFSAEVFENKLNSKFSINETESPGVNFTNILRAAFAHADPKSTKRQSSSHQCIFVLLGSLHAKVACKTLVKSTLEENQVLV